MIEVPLWYLCSCNDESLSENTDKNKVIKYIDISSVSLVNGIEQTELFVFGTAPSRARRIVRSGDILVSTVRTYLRAIALVPKEYDGCVASTGFAVLRAKGSCSSRFLHWLLKSDDVINKIMILSKGQNYPSITAEDLLNIRIRMPLEIEDQERIANYLECKLSLIDENIENKVKICTKLREYRQSLITRIVTKGLNPDVKLCDSGVVWMGKIPQHWSVCAVKWLTDITSGGTPDRTNKEYWTPGTIPWIKTGELQNNTITESEEKISLLGMKNSAAKLFPVETLLVAMYGATRGMTGLLQIPATTNQACAALMIKKQENRIIPNYLQYVFMAGCDFVRQKAVGAGQPNLSLDLIANLKVPVPPFEEQELIVKRLRDGCERVDDTIVKVTDVISKLSEYRLSLIADVLAGKGMAKGVSHV